MAAMSRRNLDRRRGARISPEHGPWKAQAVLRPGVLVTVIDIAPHGVRVSSPARLRPGRRAEIQFVGHESDHRSLVVGQVGRCRVTQLTPLCFEGVIEFDATPPDLSGY
jgi:hypothetical protein